MVWFRNLKGYWWLGHITATSEWAILIAQSINQSVNQSIRYFIFPRLCPYSRYFMCVAVACVWSRWCERSSTVIGIHSIWDSRGEAGGGAWGGEAIKMSDFQEERQFISSAFMEHDRLLMNETRGQRCSCVTGRLRLYGVFAETSWAVWGPS